jgi:hypothetical protein
VIALLAAIGAAICAAQLVVAGNPLVGRLDSTFSSNGYRRVDFGANDVAQAVFLGSNGRLVVVGTSTRGVIGAPRLALARLESDGSLDRSFGDQGSVSIAMPDGHQEPIGWTETPDGQFLAVGTTDDGYYVAEVAPDGRLVREFGNGGFATGRFGSGFNLASAIAVAPSGAIFVAGSNDSDGVVVRLSRQGRRIDTFGTHGRLLFGRFSGAGVAVRRSSELIVAGTHDKTVDFFAFTLAGTRISSFGDHGRARVATPFGGASYDFLPVRQGALRVLASGDLALAVELDNDFRSDVLITRVKAAGTVDDRFGGGDGWKTIDIGPVDAPQELIETANGDLMIGGYVTQDRFADDRTRALMLVALGADGRLSRGFGDSGIVLQRFGAKSAMGFGLLAVGNKVVAVGKLRANFVAARFQ